MTHTLTGAARVSGRAEHRSRSRVSIDEQQQQHIALPKLYGAPAYARPPAATAEIERPFDPDELPLEAERTDEERDFVSTLPARAFAPGGVQLGGGGGGDGGDDPSLQGRPFSLRSVAGRLLGGG